MKSSQVENEITTKIESKPTLVRNATDLQRLKLEKLMKNPDKAMLFPEKPKDRGMPVIPEFVRNVMGSSAGAGSGEFHVYRHLRRKEYARQKYMKEKGERDRLEDEYHQKLDDNKLKAQEKTAKRRAKRLKRKDKRKNPKQSGNVHTSSSDDVTEDESIEVTEEEDTKEKSSEEKDEKTGENIEEANQICDNENEATNKNDEEEKDNTKQCTNVHTLRNDDVSEDQAIEFKEKEDVKDEIAGDNIENAENDENKIGDNENETTNKDNEEDKESNNIKDQ